ncbi:TonB-dependent receptor [Aureispira anguillae]|uniref:TonB-dependent receptor n=1 Tax=Aureispira anguillae TaxID=2864201 RepID=A0A916DR69_9BACT|nr:TonB-dependent receptor [Aureispira anguillae]BDS11634.1 TonB-dependent receptor [Aureispira anguillae]
MPIQILEPQQKALEINLDSNIYGSFAEIGAGQEVAQYFFKAGASSGTIAKTISAYDKVVSDDIYGVEKLGRYVCESRLYKMLDHEYDLMLDRLSAERPECRLFAFADTVETINYHKTNKGQGWVGIRFQLHPQGEPNDIVLHIELLDNDIALQQQAIGMLGVNLIYACYYYYGDYTKLLASLLEGIQNRIKIDMMRINGPQFLNVDNRLVTLELVKRNMTDVAMFDAKGIPMHPSEFMYKHNALVVRGSFRPASLRTLDRLRSAEKQFSLEEDLSPRGTHTLAEITLKDLRRDTGKVDEQDYLDRVTLLNHLGQNVMITNCDQYKRLINYLADYRVAKLGIVISARGLLDIVNSKYYRNRDGRLIASYGEIFTRNVRAYVYPAPSEGGGELMTCRNLPIPSGIRYLYKHIVENRHVVDIEGFDESLLHIYSMKVLQMLRKDENGWDKLVSPKVAKYIREKHLFGFPGPNMDFEY